MSRNSLKRVHGLCDSPASSTPPQPAAKRQHLDSDASFDSFALHLPSDSPSNPFGRFRPFTPRGLPRAIPISEHLVLRLQLATQQHNVYRVVSVPVNYTFSHLSRLAQFLFGWKSVRTERNPYDRHEKIKRRVDHVFTVQKDVVFYITTKHIGFIKSGRTVARVIGNIKNVQLDRDEDTRWEREECYTLQHVWHRPGNPSEMTRAIVYDYDAFSSRKELVYITLVNESEKLKTQTLFDLEEVSNTPHVIQGSGLPDDDDDDEDFALDLEQWNEPHAFENYIRNQDDGDEEDDDDDSCPSSARLAEEQALVKKRMSAPLPARLPIDGDSLKSEKAAPPKAPAKATKVVPKKRLSEPIPEDDAENSVPVKVEKPIFAKKQPIQPVAPRKIIPLKRDLKGGK